MSIGEHASLRLAPAVTLNGIGEATSMMDEKNVCDFESWFSWKKSFGIESTWSVETSNSMKSCGVFIEQFLLPWLHSLDFDCFKCTVKVSRKKTLVLTLGLLNKK